jgi:transposase
MTLTTADLTAAGPGGASKVPVEPARPGHAVRRVFTSAYKLRIVQEHDGLTEHGAKGALLRREGLYQSSINKWRIARDRGLLASGAADVRQKGAPRPESVAEPTCAAGPVSSVSERALVSENARLTAELARTKAVLEVVGKATALLEMLSESAG